MRHRVATFKIGRSSAHRRAMLANMISSLFINGKIETTLVKAKEAGRVAEKLITLGKKGDLHHRRLAAARLRNKEAVAKLFDEIAGNYAGREGGYTRIYKLGQRRGDASEVCILMLVEADAKEEAKPAKKAAKAKKAEAKTEAPAEVKEEAKAEAPAEEAKADNE